MGRVLAVVVSAAALLTFLLFATVAAQKTALSSPELWQLWFSHPALVGGDAFVHRLWKADVAPLYPAMLFGIQHVVSGRIAAFTINVLILLLLLGILAWAGRRYDRRGHSGLVCAYVLGTAPMLIFAIDATPHFAAAAVTLVLVFVAFGLISLPARGPADFIAVSTLAALGALVHAHAAGYAAAVGACLLILGTISRRRDLKAAGALVAVVASAILGMWLGGQSLVHAPWQSWKSMPVPLSVALWELKHYGLGATAAVGLGALFFLVALGDIRSRRPASFVLLLGALFALFAAGIAMCRGELVSRDVLIAAPALLGATLLLLLDSWSEPSGFGRGWVRITGVCAGCGFLAAPILTGLPTANWHFEHRWEWTGAKINQMHAQQCQAEPIRTLTSLPQSTGFDFLLDGRRQVTDARSAEMRDVADIDCAVIAWAENYHPDGDRTWVNAASIAKVLDTFRLTNRSAQRIVVDRHHGGIVVRKAQ